MTDRLRVEKSAPTLKEISPADKRELMEGDSDSDDAERERELNRLTRDAAKFSSAVKREQRRQAD